MEQRLLNSLSTADTSQLRKLLEACLPAVPVTKKSKVPNLYEAGGEYVEQEAADELSGLKSHCVAAVVVP